MEQHHRDILRNNWVYLMDNVTLDYLLPVLFQKRILSEDLIEQIKAETTPKQKNYSFLTILQVIEGCQLLRGVVNFNLICIPGE